jgi:mannose-1-phosphate guanylyltransferase/mannose-6-phosphate isomerase
VQTVNRIKGYFARDERVLIIPKELKTLTLKYIGKEHTVIEPVRRNTAPAICLAAMSLRRRYGDGILHIMPADHLINPHKDFIAALKFSESLVRKGYIITYGIKPDHPETGYGYLKIGHTIARRNRISALQGKGFTEKPSLAKAKKYIKTKHYLWNSGIFSFSIERILEEIEHFVPEVYNGVMKYLKTKKKSYFQRIPNISIDYAVMEKSRRFCVVQGNFRWDDVGSWLALERYFKKDKYGNILIGNTKGLEIYDSIMYTNSVPLKAYGIKGLIVVVSPGGVLVCKKEKAPALKKLLK